MPKYAYCCEKCNIEFELYHGINETVTKCNICGSKIEKILSFSSILKKNNTGKIVNNAIEEAKDDLEKMKKELKEKR